MSLDASKDKDADFLVENVKDKVRHIFQEYGDDERRGVYRYLFSRRPKKLPPSMKSRIINLYDGLADRASRFPDGLRWCTNVYVGCEHDCGYCYVNGYSQDNVGISPHTKANFRSKLSKDIQDLRSLHVPAAPLHMSNSTDPLQEVLERENRHTLQILRQVIGNRDLFNSVVILTKNPVILTQEEYLSIITDPRMQPFTVQISCAFWRDDARSFYEPHAPSVQNRLDALGVLAGNGQDTWSWLC